MEIIPAIDIIDGHCVRLSKGDFGQVKKYSNKPADVAKTFEEAGIKRLHLVDLDGAKDGRVKNLSVLESIAKSTSLSIDFGGGIKTTNDAQAVMNAGAKMITIGSLGVKNLPLVEEWIKIFGADKILVGADVLDGNIKINGWLTETNLNIFDFLGQLNSIGIQQIFCTDISKDGMMQGPSLDLYAAILERFPSMSLIASGGVSALDDLYRLREAGCSGAIVGKAIYEGAISLDQLSPFIKTR